ncbi:Structural maintenance of chromosomes protein 6 [Bulinus truncatus]|nr:Structural maintenance of chromosomes protein 6 [Bulinus truncatus]
MDSVKEVGTLEPLLQQKKKELHEEKEKLMPLTNQLKSLEREITSLGQDCKQCQVRINELKAESSRDYEAERIQRTEQINKIKSKLQELESKKKVLEHEIDQYRSAVIKYKSECSNFQSILTAKQAQLKNISMNKQRLIAAKNNRLKRFGDWMPVVINDINSKRSQFHKLPKGPLGASFDLIDHKWALAVECCLKGLVSAFVCHDLHDSKLLEEIFNKCPQSRAARPIIITCAFSTRIYDVSQNRAFSRDYPCILDVITCDDVVVMNTLIDQRRIENVLLISNTNEAREVMLRNPPSKASECFTENGDQVFSSPTFRFYSNTNKNNVRYLMSDVQEQILKIEQEEKLLEEDKKNICQQIGQSQQQVTQNQAEENKCKSRLIEISKTLSSLSSKVNELQTEEDDDVPVDVKTLEEEVVDYEAKIKELKAKRDQITEEKKIQDANFDTLRKGYSQLEASIRQKSDNGIPLREEISQAQNELEKVRTAVKHYTSKLKEQQKKIQEEKEKVC